MVNVGTTGSLSRPKSREVNVRSSLGKEVFKDYTRK